MNGPLDQLERDLQFAMTRVGAPGCEIRQKAADQLAALRELRREIRERAGR